MKTDIIDTLTQNFIKTDRLACQMLISIQRMHSRISQPSLLFRLACWSNCKNSFCSSVEHMFLLQKAFTKFSARKYLPYPLFRPSHLGLTEPARGRCCGGNNFRHASVRTTSFPANVRGNNESF